MDRTTSILDDLLLRVLRLASPRRHRDGGDLKCVCRRWRELLRSSCSSCKRVRLVQLAAAAESADATPALSALQPFQNVTHVKLGTAGSPPTTTGSSWGALLRSLAGGSLPQLTSFDLTLDYGIDALCDLTSFLARRTALQSLRLGFHHVLSRQHPRYSWHGLHHVLSRQCPRYSWQAFHAYLEALDFGRLPRLEHLVLDYRGMYDSLDFYERPLQGSLVPVSRSLLLLQQHRQQEQQEQGQEQEQHQGREQTEQELQQQQQQQQQRQEQGQGQELDEGLGLGLGQEQELEQGQGQHQRQVGQEQELGRLWSAVKTFALKLPSEAQAQRLPAWLGELRPLSRVSAICTGDCSAGGPTHCWWHLCGSLKGLHTLQELSLEVHPRGLCADWLSSLLDLPRLTRLRLHMRDGSPLPAVSRTFPRLESLKLRLEGGGAGAGALDLPLGSPPEPMMSRNYFAFAPNLRLLSLWSRGALTWPVLAGLTRLTSLSIGCQIGGQVAYGQGLTSCCDIGGLPALRQLELQTCRLLPLVEGLFGLGQATAVTLHCQCKNESEPVTIKSHAVYVRAGCKQRLTPGRVRQLFQDTRGQVAPGGAG